jgi:ketosteroid isomerase-like protein
MASAWLWITISARNAVAQSADLDGVMAASRAFYAALSVLDNGESMAKVFAHTPYVTYVGPRGKSIIVGWDALDKFWQNANKLIAVRSISLVEPHIHANGNLAWEIGQEFGEVKMKDGTTAKIDGYIVTNVYEKQSDDRWLMVSHHVQPKPQ